MPPESPKRAPERLVVEGVQFLREQDGKPERTLKLALVRRFAALPGILRAYLALVVHAEPRPGVALCLRMTEASDAVQRVIVGAAAAEFGRIFGRSQHLDILFIAEEQEVRLARVCKPFFSARRETKPVENERRAAPRDLD